MTERKERGSGSDVDEQLRRFFAGAHSELKSSGGENTGGGSNPSERMPHHTVKLGVRPHDYSEGAIVGGALSLLSDYEVRVLRAHYTRHPPDTFSRLLVFEELAAVALLTPSAHILVKGWDCRAADPRPDEVKRALRHACVTAKSGKGEAKQAAYVAVEQVKRHAKAMHVNARTAFIEAKRTVIREIRAVRESQRVARRRAFETSLDVE